MSKLLLSQDELIGLMPIAENLRKDEEWLDVIGDWSALSVQRQDFFDTFPTFSQIFENGVNLEATLDFVGLTIPTTTFYYAPYDYPAQNDVIRTRKVVRFLVTTTRFRSGTGLFFYPAAASLEDYIEIEKDRPWIIDIPADVESQLTGDDVMVMVNNCDSTLFLRSLVPPLAVGENFLQTDVLNILINTTDVMFAGSAPQNPDAVNVFVVDYGGSFQVRAPQSGFGVTTTEDTGGGYGNVDGVTTAIQDWPLTTTLNATFDADKDLIAERYPQFTRHRTVIYSDSYSSGLNAAQYTASLRLTACTEDTLQQIATQLSAYNVSYGGAINWQTASASTFMSLINSHFEL